MATIPYLAIGPTVILSVIGLLKKRRKKPSPLSEDKKDITVEVLIPVYNGENTICATLASLQSQTICPDKIILIDDNSTDNTILYAKEFSTQIGLPLEIIQRQQRAGKTPSLSFMAKNSPADVIFVLDSDTVLYSNEYIGRTMDALCEEEKIASACGIIMPFGFYDNKVLVNHYSSLSHFYQIHPKASLYTKMPWYNRIAHGLTNIYRYSLYTFLQRFVFRGQMAFAGTIVNPIGCAVAYKRKYLLELFRRYEPVLGDNLTTSEDIFIGFSFCDSGYSNVIVQDILAKTKEPPIQRLHKQLFLWSSSFLQSCYYFGGLAGTPFKAFRRKPKKGTDLSMSTGSEYTRKYGRKIGWFVFAGLFEKVCFPAAVLLLAIFHPWVFLATVAIESLLVFYISSVLVLKQNLFRHILISVAATPIRYAYLVFDLFVLVRFLFDLAFKRSLTWRK